MEELSALFRWLVEGQGTFIKLFVGDVQPLASYSLYLIRSSDLILEKLHKLKNKIVEGNINTCYDVILYTDSECSIAEHFLKWRALMHNIVVDGILINERFYEINGQRCASNLQSNETYTYNYDVKRFTKHLYDNNTVTKSLYDNNERMVDKSVVNEALQHFNSYGTIVICKIKSIALKNYLDGRKKNYIFCHEFLQRFKQSNVIDETKQNSDEKCRCKKIDKSEGKVCKMESESKSELGQYISDSMVMNAVSISNKSDNVGLYGRKILSRVRNTDTLKCTKEQISNARIIGQFNNEFIIIKNECNVFIVDQHAIHERIRLEKYVSIATIKGTNYDLEALKEKACKGAIKFKDKLNIYKMKEMVRWYRYLKYPFICCHGRPTIVYIGRIQE